VFVCVHIHPCACDVYVMCVCDVYVWCVMWCVCDMCVWCVMCDVWCVYDVCGTGRSEAETECSSVWRGNIYINHFAYNMIFRHVFIIIWEYGNIICAQVHRRAKHKHSPKDKQTLSLLSVFESSRVKMEQELYFLRFGDVWCVLCDVWCVMCACVMCDVWCVMCDVCMCDVWCVMCDVCMCDVWCVMCDVWCMMYDVWCMMYDIWCLICTYDVRWCSGNIIIWKSTNHNRTYLLSSSLFAYFWSSLRTGPVRFDIWEGTAMGSALYLLYNTPLIHHTSYIIHHTSHIIHHTPYIIHHTY